MIDFHNESTQRLFEAISLLKNADECAAFFDDICTIKEVQDMAQRLDTAFMLDSGANYQSISKQIKISTATISRVSRCLNYGSGGYRLIIDRMKETETWNEA